jgi:cytochrome c-type biogenesis protein CcmH/NrfF
MRIRCDCGCPPQSAWECACGHAAGMVEGMEREARAGATAEEIVAGYLEREGAAILLEPPARGWNLTAWFGPSIVILAGAAVLTGLLRAWRRRGVGDDAAGVPTEAPDDDYRKRALEELDRFDRGGLA